MWLVRFLAVALLLVPLGATAHRAQHSVTGVYQSNWDEVRLTQHGDAVTGTYVCCGGGTIEGRIVEGRTLIYRWRQPGGEGSGVWTIKDADRLEGTWGVGEDRSGGGRWDLARSPQIAQ
jgi:hypothetical protein